MKSHDLELLDLERRIAVLECKRFHCPQQHNEPSNQHQQHDNDKDENRENNGNAINDAMGVIAVDDAMRRARYDVEINKRIYSAQWKWVPPNYYKEPLSQRAVYLGAPSTLHLCKSLLLENRKHVPVYDTRPGATKTENSTMEKKDLNPKFILVVLQYEAELNVKKLQTALLKRIPVTQRSVLSSFDVRVASSEDNDRLTGYSFNSVTPFGLLRAEEEDADTVLIVVEQEIPSFFWMGGGHVHLKLGMAKSDFIQSTSCLVANVSSPRAGGVASNDADMDD